MNLENNDELEKFKSYMLERFLELERDSRGTAWDFVGLSVSLDYLASLTKIHVIDQRTGKLKCQSGSEYFTSFINNFFPEAYSQFTYRCGSKDLPEQMYRILRCGLAHAFSLYGEPSGRGRTGSIMIGHGVDNLIPAQKEPPRDDTVILNFIPFINDVRTALNNLIEAARFDSRLKERVLKRIRAQPPLQLILE
ncbi:hypothetical protein [Komagataeibacter oboediens]|uniref:Uncharacterized protein n=1 Tax=Komagataeibacter oboediens TaxID=65958 RepID=A0ABS5SQM8_9PROT|nr:hypothetical protein [Komagataeibacter oboediens]MBL7234894.1 hypothetical protein [Komagataeibacter oboediens]MBT0676533.1 hypothetical protein [Komagataeibacter oboediens]MBT0679812.1 hypothetical protein [Komagataeibacter oboediens]